MWAGGLKPCVLSLASNVEKGSTPPGGGGTEGDSIATKLVVENDLKDAVDIAIMGPFTEERTIDSHQSLTFPNPVPTKKANKAGRPLKFTYNAPPTCACFVAASGCSM